MNNPSILRLWTMRALFIALGLAVLLGNLLPLQTLPRGWAGPDLLLLFAMVWSVRRPEYVPIPLLAILFLLADFLLSRPPGLAAALMLMAAFDMQRRSVQLRDAGFITEWLRATLLIALILLSQRFVLALLLVDQPSLGLALLQSAITALCYPLAVLVSAALFGVRSTAPGDLDALGQRR